MLLVFPEQENHTFQILSLIGFLGRFLTDRKQARSLRTTGSPRMLVSKPARTWHLSNVLWEKWQCRWEEILLLAYKWELWKHFIWWLNYMEMSSHFPCLPFPVVGAGLSSRLAVIRYWMVSLHPGGFSNWIFDKLSEWGLWGPDICFLFCQFCFFSSSLGNKIYLIYSMYHHLFPYCILNITYLI